MNTKLIALAALLVAFVSIAPAQVALTSTSLSVAVADTTSTSVVLASATGVLANGYLFVDLEAMQVLGSYSSGTTIPVRRGASSTTARAHLSAAVVYVVTPGNQARSAFRTYTPSGACGLPTPPSTTLARTNEFILPVFNILTGESVDCVTGASGAPQWTRILPSSITMGQSTIKAPYTAFTTLSPPNAIATTSVTNVNGTIYFSQIFVPTNATLTGACVLNGGTVGTDKWIFGLYNSNGQVVANTALTGTTSATASKYQCIAFTATVSVYGPNNYFIALQGGTSATDNFQTYATAGAPTNYGTQSQTGTFGTMAAMTTPTVTFTAAKGPLMILY